MSSGTVDSPAFHIGKATDGCSGEFSVLVKCQTLFPGTLAAVSEQTPPPSLSTSPKPRQGPGRVIHQQWRRRWWWWCRTCCCACTNGKKSAPALVDSNSLLNHQIPLHIIPRSAASHHGMTFFFGIDLSIT